MDLIPSFVVGLSLGNLVGTLVGIRGLLRGQKRAIRFGCRVAAFVYAITSSLLVINYPTTSSDARSAAYVVSLFFFTPLTLVAWIPAGIILFVFSKWMPPRKNHERGR